MKIQVIVYISLLFVTTHSAFTQYALIGEDREAAGPIDWSEDADKGEIIGRIMEAWAADDELWAAS